LRRGEASIISRGGGPMTSMMHSSCSVSFSPGNSGYLLAHASDPTLHGAGRQRQRHPVYSSARMQPKLHMSMASSYGRPRITSGER
jgi:hypothetical protein